jgi:hypothetical protein
MTSIRRAMAAIAAAACLAIPVNASAMPYSPSTTGVDAAQSGADGQANSKPVEPKSAVLAQERYYSSYAEPETIDADTSAAQAHERYYSSYGDPEPSAGAQSPAPSDDTPWLPIALSATVALAIVGASATQVGRLRARRRAARVAT